jgi:hypothetical protein
VDWIVIEDVAPYDGRYPLADAAEFSVREWGWVKRFAGYQPLTVDDAFRNGDAELVAVLGLIAVHRAGKFQAADAGEVWERFQEAPFFTGVRFDLDPDDQEGEADAEGPPAGNSTGNAASSGDGSTASSETSLTPLNGSGSPDSASSEWTREWSPT